MSQDFSENVNFDAKAGNDRVDCLFPHDSLRTLLSNFVLKNVEMPSDSVSFLIALLLILTTWLVVNWFVKLILSLIWPIALLVFTVYAITTIKDGNVHKCFPKATEFAKEIFLKMAIMFGKYSNNMGHQYE